MEKGDGGSGYSCSGDETMGSWSRVHSDIGYLGYRLLIQALNTVGPASGSSPRDGVGQGKILVWPVATILSRLLRYHSHCKSCNGALCLNPARDAGLSWTPAQIVVTLSHLSFIRS